METALARIRILVANQPLLMRESVTCTVADQDDVEIVGQAEDVAEIPDLVEQTRPDCVVISPEKPGQRPIICDTLLGLYPDKLRIRLFRLADTRENPRGNERRIIEAVPRCQPELSSQRQRRQLLVGAHGTVVGKNPKNTLGLFDFDSISQRICISGCGCATRLGLLLRIGLLLRRGHWLAPGRLFRRNDWLRRNFR